MSHPHVIYSIFKRRLCGDFSANWQQALKEANTLRYDKIMKSLVYRDNIPIMIELYNLNLLKVGEGDFGKVPSCILKQYQEITIYLSQRKCIISFPQVVYKIFKRRLCGDFSANWQQALKEANTLRLENLEEQQLYIHCS